MESYQAIYDAVRACFFARVSVLTGLSGVLCMVTTSSVGLQDLGIAQQKQCWTSI